jgi:hypothetical protein
MSWMLGKSIILRSQTGMQLWRNDSKDTNWALKSIKENTKTSDNEILGLYKLKQHKPFFDEESLGSLDQRKKA